MSVKALLRAVVDVIRVARLLVGAGRVEIEAARILLAGRRVVVSSAPRVLRHAVHERCPALRHGSDVGAVHQSGKPLLRRREIVIHHLVGLELRDDGREIRIRALHLRDIDVALEEVDREPTSTAMMPSTSMISNSV